MTTQDVRIDPTPTRTPAVGIHGPAGGPSGASTGEVAAERRPRFGAWAARTVGLLAVIAGVALAVWPYQRGLVGYFDGEREIVSSSCEAPLVAAFSSSSSSDRPGNVLIDENTWADGPPCQRSAAFRLALAGVILAAGSAALLTVWRQGRSSRARPVAAPEGANPGRR
jgi:hypothetical protein